MFKKIDIKIFYAIIIGLITLLIICFKIKESFIFHSDFARDLFNILKISQGNHTLLGPKLSFGGLYPASYYFYLFVPVFLFSGFNIMSLAYFNAVLFTLAISYFFINALKKFPIWKSVIASFTIAITPIFLFSSRSPSVSNTCLAFLLILLTYIYFNKIDRSLTLTILGIVFGVIINFGFISFLILLPVYLMILSKLKNKLNSLYFILGIVITFLPLLLFEIKNNFIMTKNTFFDKSYLSWIGNKNIIYGVGGKKNIIENFFYVSNKITSLLSINPLYAIVFLTILQWFEKIKKGKMFIIANSLLALLILSSLIRFQFAIHYLYPTSFFIFFVIVIVLLESRFKILLFILLLIEIIFFPKQIYSNSTISSDLFENAVKYSLENQLINKDSKFNIVMIAHPNAIIGFEYRYFFQKQGYVPLSEFEYSKADTLLVFTQKKNLDISTLDTWEINQFGKQYFINAKKYNTNSHAIYKIVKQSNLPD